MIMKGGVGRFAGIGLGFVLTATAAGAQETARVDPGGPIGERLASPPRAIEGGCYSACVLDAVKPGSCLKPGAWLGVHAASDAVGTRVYRSFIAMDAPRFAAYLDRAHAFEAESLIIVPYEMAVALGVKRCALRSAKRNRATKAG